MIHDKISITLFSGRKSFQLRKAEGRVIYIRRKVELGVDIDAWQRELRLVATCPPALILEAPFRQTRGQVTSCGALRVIICLSEITYQI
jgi:hypothetical protein